MCQLGKRQLSFGESARQAMLRRREIDTFLRSVAESAHEHPVGASSHLYHTALYWRRVWRRQYLRLGRKAKRRLVVGNNQDVKLVFVECSEPHEVRRVLYATWKFTLWDCALRNMLDAALEAVMNSMRNGLGMRKTGDRRKPGQPDNPHSNAVFTQVHNTL